STDWFYNRRTEIERLRQALSAAWENAGAVQVAGANVIRQTSAEPSSPPIEFVVPETVVRTMPSYVRAHFPVHSYLEPHEVPMATLGPLTLQIVETEGPICLEEVSRRVAGCFGREKAGKRIIAATRRALSAQRQLTSHLRND